MAFISTFIQTNHYAPTVRELGDHFNVANATVKHYLNDLRSSGEIDWAEGKQRTIHVTNGAPAGVSETRRETACGSEPALSQRPSPSSPSASRRASGRPKRTTTTEA